MNDAIESVSIKNVLDEIRYPHDPFTEVESAQGHRISDEVFEEDLPNAPEDPLELKRPPEVHLFGKGSKRERDKKRADDKSGEGAINDNVAEERGEAVQSGEKEAA